MDEDKFIEELATALRTIEQVPKADRRSAHERACELLEEWSMETESAFDEEDE